MKLLITGGAGFVGARLARTLLARGTLDGRAIAQVVIADQAAAPADLLADARVQGRVGKLLTHVQGLRDEAFDGVFHLASAVSGECETDFELGLHSNLDSTRALLDALRHRQEQGAAPTKLVFSSSVAVFGPDPAVPFAGTVADDTLPTPQTSYGTHKLICEHLVADYTRTGYIDGRTAMNLPALNVKVSEMLAALEEVAGKAVRARVRFERDERIAGIVANWPTGATAGRAAALGLKPDTSFADIVRQYIADCEKGPNAAEALTGLAR